jgi:hypothetical protein
VGDLVVLDCDPLVDIRYSRTIRAVRWARRAVAIVGFLIEGVSIPVAMTLDIGGAFAGSVSADMNTLATAPILERAVHE